MTIEGYDKLLAQFAEIEDLDWVAAEKEGMEIIVGDLSQNSGATTQQRPANNPLVPNIGGGRGRGGGF